MSTPGVLATAFSFSTRTCARLSVVEEHLVVCQTISFEARRILHPRFEVVVNLLPGAPSTAGRAAVQQTAAQDEHVLLNVAMATSAPFAAEKGGIDASAIVRVSLGRYG